VLSLKRIGIVVLLAGLALLAGSKYWLATRNLTALNIAVSLSPRHIRTEEFNINLDTDYYVEVEVDGSLSAGNLECLMWGCSGPSILKAHWVLSRAGQPEASGASEDISGASGNIGTVERIVGRFSSHGGRYTLDVDILSDTGFLAPRNPRLKVEADGNTYNRLDELFSAIYWTSGLIAGIGAILCLGSFSVLAPFSQGGWSWLVIAFGIAMGLFGIVLLCHIPVFEDDPHEFDPRAPFALLALVALPASVRATRNRRQGGLIYLLASPLLGACIVWWRYYDVEGGVSLLQHALMFTVASLWFIVPGAFWLLTARAGWPPLLRSRVSPAVLLSFFAACLVVSVFAWLSLFSAGFEECGKIEPPFSAPRSPNHVAFTAKVVLVGPAVVLPYSTWSLVRVQRRFWELPGWVPGFVILRGYFEKGDRGEYFVDGIRSAGLLPHFLPIIDPYPCGRTGPLDRATLR